MRRLLLLTVALIVYGSLYPWRFNFDVSGDPLSILLHSWPTVWSRYILRDVVFNFVLYLPVGALVVLNFRRRDRAAIGGAIFGFLLSFCMEFLQVYVPGRDPSLSDVASNTAGALAGCIAALVFGGKLDRAFLRASRQTAASAILLLAAWTCAQMYPFFPVFSQTRIRNTLAAVWMPASFSLVQAFTATAEWLAVAVMIEIAFGEARRWWVALALACLPLRILVVTRTLRAEELCGAAAALLLWLILRGTLRLRVAVVLIAAAVVVAELTPFHFTDSPARFSWIPFASSFTAPRESGLIVFTRKLFDYGAVLWLWRRAGTPYRAGAAVLAPALLVLEWIQRYLPGHVPEVSDSVLALLIALALWFCDSRKQR